MRQQEIFKNMTKGEWSVTYSKFKKDPKVIVDGIGVVEEMAHGKYTVKIMDTILPDSDGEYIKQHSQIAANAAAIVSAVNNTWGKHLDPESVELMYKALFAVKEFIESEYIRGFPEDQVIKALTAAKLTTHDTE